MKYKLKATEKSSTFDAIKFDYTNQKDVNEFLANHGYTAKYFAERRPNGKRWCELYINPNNPPMFYKDEKRIDTAPLKIPADVIIIAHDDDNIFYELEKAFLERYQLSD